MTYRIEQTNHYLGNDHWEWRARIEGTDDEVNAIDCVVWNLHPSYEVAVVESRDRSNKFEIKRIAWGRFQLRADLKLSNGETQKLRKQLQLWYPDEESATPEKSIGTPTRGAKPKQGTQNIFVSYGMDDRSIAGAVIGALKNNGYQVLDVSQVAPGSPWQPSVQKMLRDSDLVLGISSSDFASPYVVTELNSAHRAAKPILTLVTPGVGSVYGLDPGVKHSEVDVSDPSFEVKLIDMVKGQLD